MTVGIAPHRGDATTRALVEAAAAGVSIVEPPSSGELLVIMELGALDAAALTAARVIVANGDDQAVEAAVSAVEGRVIRVGYSSTADVRATDISVSLAGTRFVATVFGRPIAVRLTLIGERHVLAALAALAVAHELGIDPDAAAAALSDLPGSEPRNLEVLSAAGGVTIIDDGYDLGSRSTTEALKTLAEITHDDNRSVAVLGEVAGLDGDTRDEHDRIGRIVVRLNIGLLVVIGSAARHLYSAAGLEGSWDGESVIVDDAAKAYDLLRAELKSGDVVLIKSGLANAHSLGEQLGGIFS